ncbi:MAG: hypothetical protein GY707_03295 [Desulfobacteraceae bacterium]|nr:hypothetical protein [Desulfobacteraceae bacterium]
MNDFLKNLRSAQADKQRSGKKRKNYDTSYHYAAQSQPPRYQPFSGAGRNPRNTGTHGRKHEVDEMPLQQNDPAMSLLADAVENLSSLVDVLAKNQEYLITVQEKANDTLERQAGAIEEIVGYLNFVTEGYPGESIEEEVYVEPVSTPQVAKPVKKQAKPKVKKEVPVEQERKILKRRKGDDKSVGVAAAKTPDSKLMSREAIMDIIYSMREKGATYDDVATQLISLGQPTFSGRGEWHAQTIHRLCTKK